MLMCGVAKGDDGSKCGRRSENTVMAVQITISDVPEEVRDRLAACAERRGKSLQEFLRGELVGIAGRSKLSNEELMRKVQEIKAAEPKWIPAEVILQARDEDRR